MRFEKELTPRDSSFGVTFTFYLLLPAKRPRALALRDNHANGRLRSTVTNHSFADAQQHLAST
jgi:hypothetical protein